MSEDKENVSVVEGETASMVPQEETAAVVLEEGIPALDPEEEYSAVAPKEGIPAVDPEEGTSTVVPKEGTVAVDIKEDTAAVDMEASPWTQPVLDSLECPVCTELMTTWRKPVVCKHGHSHCTACHQNMVPNRRKCPICNEREVPYLQ